MPEKIWHSLCYSKGLEPVIGKFFPVPLSSEACTSALVLSSIGVITKLNIFVKEHFCLEADEFLILNTSLKVSCIFGTIQISCISCSEKKKWIPWNKIFNVGLFDSLTSVLRLLNVTTD